MRAAVHRPRAGRRRSGASAAASAAGEAQRLQPRHRRDDAQGDRRHDRRDYYPAESADQLDAVFANLPTNLITKHEVVELSVVFVAIGALLVAVAILLGQAWRPLP